MNIIGALGQLANEKCFIVYKVVPIPGKTKVDKIPVDPYRGDHRFPIDAQDPASWLTAHEAALWASNWGPEYGVGIVITEGSGLFCIDVDDCLQADGTWSPHAVATCQRFPGAYLERSVSQRALHIMGRYTGLVRAHSSKCAPIHTEAYTRRRFIALTGDMAQGDIASDHTAALDQFLGEYFPPRPEVESAAEWTSAPVPQWSGPADDNELIQKAAHSRSAGAVFGARVSFADLWVGNGDRLQHFYPSPTHDEYDRSSADQALANYLAFWTGNNCDRMLKLMNASGLIRDKWNRPDYLPGTIMNACATQREWYNDGGSPAASTAQQPVQAAPAVSIDPQPPAPAAAGGQFPVPAQMTATISAEGTRGPTIPIPEGLGAKALKPREQPPPGFLATATDQQAMFDGVVYVEDIDRAMMPDGTLLDKTRFDNRFPGVTFIVTPDGTKPTRSAWEAFVQSEVFAFPKVRGLYFMPTAAAGAIVKREGLTFLNSWVPIDLECTPGDYMPFWNHIKKLLPLGHDAEILLYYLAAMVQYQGTKFTWCPFIQGVEGNGKSFLCEAIERCIGARYTHRGNAAKLGSEHNGELYGKIFLRFDEVKIDHARHGNIWETLKNMISETSLEIRAMQTDKVTREVCFNLMMLSNYKNGLRKTDNDRRMAPFFCAQQTKGDLLRDGLTQGYFDELWAWANGGGWAIINWFLRNIQIPDEYNPAGGCRRAPDTTSTLEAIQSGWGTAEQEVLEAIQAGYDGFRDGWVSSTALDALLTRVGKGNTIPRNARKQLLTSLGYMPHPALPEGRVTSKLPDGSRPVLFVRADSDAARLTSVLEVMSAYGTAQKK